MHSVYEQEQSRHSVCSHINIACYKWTERVSQHNGTRLKIDRLISALWVRALHTCSMLLRASRTASVVRVHHLQRFVPAAARFLSVRARMSKSESPAVAAFVPQLYSGSIRILTGNNAVLLPALHSHSLLRNEAVVSMLQSCV